MTTRMLLSNVASFGVQVTLLVAAGAALARVFRVDEPKALLAYWRTLLLACLVLPVCQPWNTVTPAGLDDAAMRDGRQRRGASSAPCRWRPGP